MKNDEQQQHATGGSWPATLAWIGGVDGHLRLIDQTRLPVEFGEIDCRDVETVWEAIKTLRVRGAPAIGIAAAYGVCLGLQGSREPTKPRFFERLEAVAGSLATQPAHGRQSVLGAGAHAGQSRSAAAARPRRERFAAALLAEARAIHEEDRQMCRAIGRHGAELLSRRPGRADALQRRRAGHFRLRHGPGRVLCRRRVGQEAARLRRRNPAAAAGRPADRLGIAAARHRRDVDLRHDGRPGDARGPRAGGGHRGRPDRRQRRHGQQDRHLRRGRAGRGPRHSVLRRRPDQHVRSVDRRAARRFRSSSATRAKSRTVSAGKPRPRASRSTIRPSTSRRPS